MKDKVEQEIIGAYQEIASQIEFLAKEGDTLDSIRWDEVVEWVQATNAAREWYICGEPHVALEELPQF